VDGQAPDIYCRMDLIDDLKREYIAPAEAVSRCITAF